MNRTLRYILAVALGLFASLTLFLSSSVILDLFDIREKEGNYVLFVVWSNFISSILYLLAVYGLVKAKKWTTLVLLASVLILLAAFIGLNIYISNGGIYEIKTVNAMIFRIGLTFVFAIASYFLISKQKLVKQ
ncbi:MAG: hypothetical protein IPH34_04525 [Chitinophagaceae bacterium]|nr:hypothetical protein [Chitinophagaceae bacterium]MBK8310724.1 hypothetical protein [Chitinophagaceae bacterium]MBK8607294.1 hypothetical protein [Chitinophagaceae bacterium]MBP6477929.1 hypothetical protein [Chitinophagaceae bacterium]MBP7108765.1 hypothetical protein [Chitinophagaceae bacterium]